MKNNSEEQQQQEHDSGANYNNNKGINPNRNCSSGNTLIHSQNSSTSNLTITNRNALSATAAAVPVHGKKLNRCRSFHFRYLELCRAKNFTPVPEIKAKNNATSVLDFFGDKLRPDDWLLVMEALHYDQILQNLAIRLRKNFGGVVEHIDTEKKAKLFKQRPVIYTKYIFSGVMDAVSNCIQFNRNLQILILEALPLNEKFVVSIAKALSTTENLKQISFQRSPIGDLGCESICGTIKYLASVEALNLSECDLTTKGATFVADMIKFQKICRYSEGWQKSLRYRDVDPDSIPGLRVILIGNNPRIGDEGATLIVEILKEDVWIKIIDMENCGLTDAGANNILDCLEINNYIVDFNVRGNTGISKFLLRTIRQQLGKEDGQEIASDGTVTGGAKKTKVTVAALKERMKFLEEQIASERVLRKQVELLNEKLHEQIVAYENQIAQKSKGDVPDGYVLVKNESLESIIRERNELEKIASAVRVSKVNSNYIKKLNKVRKAKSETKWINLSNGGRQKQDISKSDQEFGGDQKRLPTRLNNNVVVESNIGDSTNVGVNQPIPGQLTARIAKANNKCFDSSSSDASSIGSDTIRNQFQNSSEIKVTDPMKIIITQKQTNLEMIETRTKQISPRALFLGIRD